MVEYQNVKPVTKQRFYFKSIMYSIWRLQNFFQIHKVGITGFFALLTIANKGEIDISGKIFNSASLYKFKFVLEYIWLTTVCDLFTLEVVQKCQ